MIIGQGKNRIVEDHRGESNAQRESAAQDYLLFNPGWMFKREGRHSQSAPESGG